MTDQTPLIEKSPPERQTEPVIANLSKEFALMLKRLRRLATEEYQQAFQLFKALKFEQAEELLLSALQHNRDNAHAKKLLQQVQTILKKEAGKERRQKSGTISLIGAVMPANLFAKYEIALKVVPATGQTPPHLIGKLSARKLDQLKADIKEIKDARLFSLPDMLLIEGRQRQLSHGQSRQFTIGFEEDSPRKQKVFEGFSLEVEAEKIEQTELACRIFITVSGLLGDVLTYETKQGRIEVPSTFAHYIQHRLKLGEDVVVVIGGLTNPFGRGVAQKAIGKKGKKAAYALYFFFWRGK